MNDCNKAYICERMNMIEIQDVSDAQIAFPFNVQRLMVPMDEIPKEFDRGENKWCKIMTQWFFKGLSQDAEFYPKKGIDTNKAIRHLKAIIGSFEPKHEHKSACVSYLLSLWFDDIKNYEVD